MPDCMSDGFNGFVGPFGDGNTFTPAGSPIISGDFN